MSRRQIEFLKSEIGAIKSLISGLSDVHDLERMQFEELLIEKQVRLRVLENKPQPKPLPIVFRGAPVQGVRSIDAGFAASALTKFLKATDEVVGLQESYDRQHDKRSLRIIDTAVGSFGFEMELEPHHSLPLDNVTDPVADGISETIRLIASAASGDVPTGEISPQVAKRLHAFTNHLKKSKALLKVEFEGVAVDITDDEALDRVVSFFKAKEKQEYERHLPGRVLGILPESRQFEARVDGIGLVSGKLDSAIADPMAFQDVWVNKRAMLTLRVTSKPEQTDSYVLVDCNFVASA